MEILSTVIMFGAMFGIMYFLLIRPQKKQQEKIQDMLSNLEVGDSIVTIGGLHGMIDEIDETAQTVVLDCEGIYLTFDRRAVARVLAKGTQTETVTTTTTTTTTVEPEDLGTNEPDIDRDATEE